MSELKRPTLDEVLVGSIDTIQNMLLPNLHDTWARTAAGQLIGMLRYGRTLASGEETIDSEIAELKTVITNLYDAHPHLKLSIGELPLSNSENEAFIILDLSSSLLNYALKETDKATEMILSDLRPLLVSHLEASLRETSPMLMSFGGDPGDVEH